MPTGEKLAFLGEAVERNDGPTIAALVNVPLFLSGLSENQASQYKRLYLQKAVPLDTTYIDATETAVAAVCEAANAMLA